MKIRLFIISIAALAVLAGCQNQQSTQGADVSVPVRVADVAKKSIYNT
jgi:uncharacterized lipoprotein YajG